MSDHRSIAVITCTLNSSATLRRNIESVNEQSYENYRHIFIDGKSTDSTLDIIRDCAKNSVILSERDDGVYHAFNRGLDAVADYDVFGFLHADDYFTDKFCLERVSRAFLERPEIGYFCAKVIYVSPGDGKVLDTVGKDKKSMTWWRYLRRSNEYAHPSFYCRTELIPQVGRFDTRYTISADIDWIIRLENICKNYHFDPNPLVKMTIGGKSASCPRRAFYEEYCIFKKFRKRKFNLFFLSYYVARSAIKNLMLKSGLGRLVKLARKMFVQLFGD